MSENMKTSNMANWTESEKTEYLNLLRNIARGTQPSEKELHNLTDNVKNGMINMYQDLLYPNLMTRTFRRLKG